MVTVPAELLLEKILPRKTTSSFPSAPYSAHCEWLQAERTLASKISKLFVPLKKKVIKKKRQKDKVLTCVMSIFKLGVVGVCLYVSSLDGGRSEDQEFKALLSYVASCEPDWAT